MKVSNNLKLGSAHLKDLSNKLKGNYMQMAAAYNAGHRRLKKWLPKHKKIEPTIWIETIPWRETRNYLKNVMTYLVIYEHRLGNKIGIQYFLRR